MLAAILSSSLYYITASLAVFRCVQRAAQHFRLGVGVHALRDACSTLSLAVSDGLAFQFRWLEGSIV